MINIGSKVVFVDNSGAKRGVCIKIYKKFRYMHASIGDILLVTIRRYRKAILVKNRLVKIGDICLAITIATKKEQVRCIGGTTVSFGYNGVVLINNDFLPKAKRFNSCVALEIRKHGNARLMLLARNLY